MRTELSGLTKSYKFIFSFPSLKVIISEIIALSFLWLILSFSFPKIFSLDTLFLELGSSLLFALTLYTFDKRIFTLRRSIALIPFFIVWGIIYDLINPFSVIPLIPPLLTFLTVSFFLSNNHLLKTIFAAYILFISIFILPNTYVLIIIILYNILLLIVYYRIDKRVYKHLNIGGIQLFYSFIKYILSGDKKTIENTLLSIGKKKEIPIYRILFYNRKKIIGNIIVSYIHPGPFRDLGSSTLPYKIISLSLKQNIPIVYLKGTCTHTENLITSDLLDTISKNIIFQEHEKTRISLEDIKRITIEDISSLHFIFDKILLSLVSRLERGMEDIPYEIREYISNFFDREIIVVDSHNRLALDKSYDTPFIGNELAKKIIRTFKFTHSSNIIPFKVGFAYYKVKDTQYEIGPGGVMFLAIQTQDNKNYFIISFDGNNMIDGTRDYIYNKIIQLGFTDGEVTTTDTHIYSGLIPGVEYHAVGETLSKEYLGEITENLALQALANLTTVTNVEYVKIPISSFFMDGEKLKLLSDLTYRNQKDGLFLIATLFLTYLLVFI